MGRGGRSCSRAQGIAHRQRWGQEGIFPRGTLALLPGGFLPSSAALSMTTCQGSSRPFWLGYCLLLTHHQDGLSCPAAGGRKAFLSPRQASKCLRGFLPSSAALSTGTCRGCFGPFWPGACCSCSTKVALVPRSQGEEAFQAPRARPGWPPGLLLVLSSTKHSPLSGLLWALAARSLPAAPAPPRHRSCPASLCLSCPSLPKDSGASLACQKAALASRSGMLLKIPRTSSSSSFVGDRSRSSFFKFTLFRKRGLLGRYSCCHILSVSHPP